MRSKVESGLVPWVASRAKARGFAICRRIVQTYGRAERYRRDVKSLRRGAVAALGAAILWSQTQQLNVGSVKDDRGFHEGGCELLQRAERYVFLSDFEGRAVMNINGRDTKLTLVRSKESEQPLKKGDRSVSWYQAGDLEVRVDYTVSGLCPPQDESCEVVHYNAIIQVVNRALKRTVAVRGICGP